MLGLDHSGVAGASMVLQGSPGDESMQTLHADDIAGVCLAYRMAFDPQGCPVADDGFCAASPASQTPWQPVGLVLLAICGLLWGRFTRFAHAGLY